MKDIPTIHEIDGEILATVRSLYWFNIWFAVEANRGDVVNKIIDVLGKIDINIPLDTLNEIIDQKIEDYSDYKSWVEDRAKNSDFNSELA